MFFNIKITFMAKSQIKELTNREVLEIEESCKIVCGRLETIIRFNNLTNESQEYQKFIKYQALYEDVIKELEKRLNEYA